MKKKIYSLLLISGVISLFPGQARAQYNLGVATSNWSGTNALNLNPALIADSREKLVIDVIAVNGGVDNNLGTFRTNGGLTNAINNGNINNLFNYSNNSTFSLLAPYVQIQLPGVIWSINSKHSLAFTNRVRGINQFNNFDQSLFRTVGDPNYVIGSVGTTTFTSKNFNYTAHMWAESGITYAGVLLDQDEHEIRVGATLRYLDDIGYIGLKGRNVDVTYKSGNDSVHVTNSDIEFASNILTTKNAVLSGGNNNSVLSQIFGANTGSGIGGDIGVVYDYMPDFARSRYDMDGFEGNIDHSRNRYMLRFSASIMDIGAINYSDNVNSNANVSGNGYITGKGLSDSVKNYEDFRNYAVKHGFSADTSHHATKVYMPTTLRLAVDYNLYRNFYVNAMYIRNLGDRMNFGNTFYDQVTVTPRFDRKMLSVGIPITYSMLTSGFKAGVGLRYSGFFIGSDDVLALMTNNQSGLNVYVGGFIPFYKNRKHDRDGDHISDDEDQCPDAYGTFENRGCPEPDAEHGGSSDTTDNCPDMPHTLQAPHRGAHATGTIAPVQNDAADVKRSTGEMKKD